MNKQEITPPRFTIHDVRYAADEGIIMREEGLVKQNKVKLEHCDKRGYSAYRTGKQTISRTCIREKY